MDDSHGSPASQRGGESDGDSPEVRRGREPWLEAFPEHREELQELLDADGSFFWSRAGAARGEAAASSGQALPAATSQALAAGSVLGGFRLVRILGAGGMGQVWEAEEFALERRVALKLVRPDRVSERNLALFAREARAGGRLSHPGIVRVHGFGETDGLHWINQELVEGGWTLRDFIDQMRKAEALPEGYYRRVTQLTVLIAEALQAAHDAGVIHRDVKPQNVLLDPDDRPRVTDFGLARIASDLDLSESGQLVGTYHYMSPEQVRASRSEIDHRTDIFSLGAVLFELLSLQRPFEGDSSHQITERILHDDPPDLRKLRSRLPLDLARIAGKALEKRREARYPSMDALAADLRCFLQNRPIEARPPSTWQRTAKWVVRHPTASTAAALGLISMISITVLLLRYVNKSRELTEQRDRLQTVVEFQGGLFDDLDQGSFGARLRKGTSDELAATLRARGRSEEEVSLELDRLRAALAPVNFVDLGVRALREEILDPAHQRILDAFSGDPVTQATLMGSIAHAYERAGLLERALELQQRALKIRRESVGGDDSGTIVTLNAISVVLQSLGRFDEAMRSCEEALSKGRRIHGERHLQTIGSMNNMGSLLAAGGDYDAALRYLEDALETSRTVLGADAEVTLICLGDVASVLEELGRFDEALRYHEDALATARRAHGNDHSTTLASLNNLGHLLVSMGRPAEARPLLEEGLETSRRVLGDDHPETLTSMGNMGVVLEELEMFDEAMPYTQEALARSREIRGSDHQETLICVNNMGSLLYALRRFEEALPYYEEALEGSRRVLGDNDQDTLTSLYNMGTLLESMGRFDEALPYFREELEACRRVFGDADPATLASLYNMGSRLESMGRYEEALPYFSEELEQLRKSLGDEDPGTLISINNLGCLFLTMGRYEQAQPLLEEVLESRRRIRGDLHSDTLTALNNYGFLLEAMGRFEDALPFYEEALLGHQSAPIVDQAAVLEAEVALGSLLREMGDLDRACAVLEPAVARARVELPADARVLELLSAELLACYEVLEEQRPGQGFGSKIDALRQ